MEKASRFRFQKLRESLGDLSHIKIPTTKPNRNYIETLFQEKKSQTLYDIWVGLGWKSQISAENGRAIGMLINYYLPKREFIKAIHGENEVRLYHYYEVPFIVSLIFTYFGLFQYIPHHWQYAFYVNTNIYYILYHMLHVPAFAPYVSKIQEILQDGELLSALQDKIIQEFSPYNSHVINTNEIIQYYHKIPLYQMNAKYGISVELFILHQLH